MIYDMAFASNLCFELSVRSEYKTVQYYIASTAIEWLGLFGKNKYKKFNKMLAFIWPTDTLHADSKQRFPQYISK